MAVEIDPIAPVIITPLLFMQMSLITLSRVIGAAACRGCCVVDVAVTNSFGGSADSGMLIVICSEGAKTAGNDSCEWLS